MVAMWYWGLFFILVLKVELGWTGLLSRSGICPHPTVNYVVKDTRLNFYGLSYFLPGDEHPLCTTQECQYDSDCHSDKKCCSNHCGASVCTESVRDPQPCQYFTCPIQKVCKIQKIKCIEPVCPDLMTIARPMCVNGGPIWEMGKRSRVPLPDIKSYEKESSRQVTVPNEYASWNPLQYNMYNTLSNWMNYYGKRKRST